MRPPRSPACRGRGDLLREVASRIVTRHLLPLTFPPAAGGQVHIVVTATFSTADSIDVLSALSFLGIGPPPPFTDWGTMLTNGVDNLFNGYWWQVYPPLIVLVLIVVAFRQGRRCAERHRERTAHRCGASAAAVPGATAVRSPSRLSLGLATTSLQPATTARTS